VEENVFSSSLLLFHLSPTVADFSLSHRMMVRRQDDKKIEIALCEFEEIIVRSVLQKSKVNEDGLPQQLDLFIKRFLRYNV